MPNRCLITLLWLVAFAAGYTCLATTSWAQGLEISPILIELAPGQMTTTLTVTNKGTAAAGLQLRSFQWDQGSGTDNLKPTSDLAVSPPITKVEAGQAQTFRLVLRHAAAGKETSYRLLLDQLPIDSSAGTVLIVLRLSIPVFAKAEARTESSLSWRIVTDQSGASLVAVNRGGAHVRLIKPVLTQVDGQRLVVPIDQSPYILSGAERSWHIQTNNPLRPGATLHLAAVSDGGPIDAVVHVSAP